MNAVAGVNWREAESPSESEFSLGFEASPNGFDAYLRCQASGAIAEAAAVRIDGNFQATELTEAEAVKSKTIGVSPSLRQTISIFGCKYTARVRQRSL